MSRNPFRDRMMRDVYDNAVQAFDEKRRLLFFPDGSRCLGNGFASFFWRGYDGVTPGQWDRASKRMLGYAAWRAGRDIAARA